MDNEDLDGDAKPATISLEPSNSSILLGIVGGVVAAIVTGVIWWSDIVGVSGYIYNLMPLVVGVLCGYATILLGRGRGVPFQVIAVIASIGGIFIGEYGEFYEYSNILSGDSSSSYPKPESLSLSNMNISGFLRSMRYRYFTFDYEIMWALLALIIACVIARKKKYKIPRA